MSEKFSYGEFTRYLAGNCDSESLIKSFKEDSFVGNAEEYLDARSPWKKPKDKYGKETMREVNHSDPALSKAKVDMGMMSQRGDTWAMFLEAKWIYESRSIKTYVEEILKDIFRLSLLVDNSQNKIRISPSASRMLLIGGYGDLVKQVLDYDDKFLKKFLKTPQILKSYSRFETSEVSKYLKKYRDYFIKAEEQIGRTLPTAICSRMDGRSTSKIGETKNDKPIHIVLWRIIPQNDVEFSSFKEK